MATLDGGRIGIGAQALGIAQAAYDFARNYALERKQSKRVAEFQAIQWKLADGDGDRPLRRLVSAPRGSSSRASAHRGRREGEAVHVGDGTAGAAAEAIQILGGYGYTKEFPVERYYRDAKITEIYEGRARSAASSSPARSSASSNARSRGLTSTSGLTVPGRTVSTRKRDPARWEEHPPATRRRTGRTGSDLCRFRAEEQPPRAGRSRPSQRYRASGIALHVVVTVREAVRARIRGARRGAERVLLEHPEQSSSGRSSSPCRGALSRCRGSPQVGST